MKEQAHSKISGPLDANIYESMSSLMKCFSDINLQIQSRVMPVAAKEMEMQVASIHQQNSNTVKLNSSPLLAVDPGTLCLYTYSTTPLRWRALATSEWDTTADITAPNCTHHFRHRDRPLTTASSCPLLNPFLSYVRQLGTSSKAPRGSNQGLPSGHPRDPWCDRTQGSDREARQLQGSHLSSLSQLQ